MKCKRLAITWIALLALLLSTGSVIGQEPNPQAEAKPQGDVSLTASVSSRISYQGLLQEDGMPVSGSRDMVFGLCSNDTCTTQVGSDIVKNGVLVSDGLFSVELDVNHDDFNGQRLWLEVEVGGTAIGCQEILPAPYALSLRPGATVAESDNRVELNRHYQQSFPLPQLNTALYAEAVPTFILPNNLYYGIQALGRDIGVLGESNSSSGKGVFGHATATSGTNYGIYGSSDSHDGVGVYGTAAVIGVEGHAAYTAGASYGVYGESDSSEGSGVYGRGLVTGVKGSAVRNTGITYGVEGRSHSPEGAGVYGAGSKYGVQGSSYSSEGSGMYGYASASTGTTRGVYGESDSVSGTGVYGWASALSGGTYGVYGQSRSISGTGVLGSATAPSGDTYGVHGRSMSNDGWGVYGEAPRYGVYGHATDTGAVTSIGVYGLSDSSEGNGVVGLATDTSGTVYGVVGTSQSPNGAGMLAAGRYGGADLVLDGDTWYWDDGKISSDPFWPSSSIYLVSNHDVQIELDNNADDDDANFTIVNGDDSLIFNVDDGGTTHVQVLHITGGSDLAEPFEIAGAGSLVPGLVVAIDPEHPGQLRVADRAYDRTVAGCVSGANGLNPGLTLEQEGLTVGGLPVALSGRVYCWADASYGSIQPGDLLTSSDTPGHAMRVSAYERAQGAIIGKAMSSLDEGQGLILVLVTLQ
jgi:hypothetical protein